MLAASGCCASLTSDVWNRPIANLVETFARAGRWWTGEDSNLRSPQGAADLQSAGFSHSPTRPGKIAASGFKSPGATSETLQSLCHAEYCQALANCTRSKNTNRARVKRHQPVNFYCQDSLR